MKGYFLAFEGVNGAGKTTIIKDVANRLKEENYDVFTTYEPTETNLGKFARKNEEDLHGIPLACLMAADRYHHAQTVITEKLKEEKVVLCDRYILSGYVYNRLDGVDYDYTDQLYRHILKPDLIIVLQASISLVEKRLKNRKQLTRYEKIGFEEEHRIYKESLDYLRQKGLNIIEIEVDEDEQTVLNILELIKKQMNEIN